MNNRRVAEMFGQGANRGRTKNMFIEGDTIYSYGYHFPIARRVRQNGEEYFAFNTRGYSNTTARHQSLVRGNLPSDRVIEVRDADIQKSKEQMDYNMNRLNFLSQKAMRARKRREMWERQIQDTLRQNEKLKKFII